MNLHGIVSPYIAAINPPVTGTLWVSAGNVQNADYTRTSSFTAITGQVFQVQALTGREIEHLDSLNIQGIFRGVYLNGSIEGLDRQAGKGGDILQFNGSYWLVSAVLEPWDSDGWTKVAVTLQNGKPAGIP